MKKMRILLTMFMLLTGIGMAWATEQEVDYTDSSTGITYHLLYTDAAEGKVRHYAWVKRLVTSATDFSIPASVTYNGSSYNVVGFTTNNVQQFSCQCPNLTTLRIPDSHVPTDDDMSTRLGIFCGNFTGMPNLTDIYFNADTWKLCKDYGLDVSFAGDITVHATTVYSIWKIDSHVKNYYLIPEFSHDGVGYQIRNNEARVVAFDANWTTITVPATVTNNGTTYSVGRINAYGADLYIRPYMVSTMTDITFEGNIIVCDLNLSNLASLKKITFNGNVTFSEDGSCNFGAPRLQEVRFKGKVNNLESTLLYAQALRKVFFYDELPNFYTYDLLWGKNVFYDSTIITLYVNMTAEEIMALQAGEGRTFWDFIDIRPLDGSLLGGVVVGNLTSWYIRLIPEQTLSLTYLRLIGEQNSDDMTRLKKLCDGTTASVKTLDLREMTLPIWLPLSIANFSKLDTLYLPRTPVKIDDGCFAGCKSNLVVISSSAVPYATYSETGFGEEGANVSGMTLYVPGGSDNVYKSTVPWNYFGHIIAEDTPIAFKDSRVKDLCVANWDSNHDGLFSTAEAAAVTSLSTVFKGNTQITSFDELHYFTRLTKIDSQAFSGCTKLASIILPESITTIEASAFYGCKQLTKVDLPESLTTIGNFVFMESGLRFIYIPAGVTSIGSRLFYDCKDMISIVVDDENTIYDSRDDCNAIILTETIDLQEGCRTTVIPDETNEISASAFRARGVPSLVIPASVSSIGDYAFASMSESTGHPIHYLQRMELQWDTPLEARQNMFGNEEADYPKQCTLVVPRGKKAKYVAAGWTTTYFKEIVEKPAEPSPYLKLTMVNGAGGKSWLCNTLADEQLVVRAFDGAKKATLTMTKANLGNEFKLKALRYPGRNNAGASVNGVSASSEWSGDTLIYDLGNLKLYDDTVVVTCLYEEKVDLTKRLLHVKSRGTAQGFARWALYNATKKTDVFNEALADLPSINRVDTLDIGDEYNIALYGTPTNLKRITINGEEVGLSSGSIKRTLNHRLTSFDEEVIIEFEDADDLERYDVNRDKTISIADVTALVNKILGKD